MSSRIIAASIATGIALLACGGPAQEVVSVGAQTAHPVPAGAITGPYVQAGTPMTVRLDQVIDTFYTPPGTRFTATVATPLVGQDGKVLVPQGAQVRGTLASVGTEDMPVVRVDFESIDTVAGRVPFYAAVRAAQHYDWKGPPVPERGASYIYGYDFGGYGTETVAPGLALPGQPVEGRTLMQPREIRIPAGALLKLELTDPLVLPGAQLAK